MLGESEISFEFKSAKEHFIAGPNGAVLRLRNLTAEERAYVEQYRGLVKAKLGIDTIIEDEKPTTEVEYGQWQPVLDPTSGQPCTDEWYGYVFKCSACGHTTISDDALVCQDCYCHNCGRPMNGGTNK